MRTTVWRVAGEGGSEKVHAFCPICGTPVYLTAAAMPDLIALHAASLDDPSLFSPTVVTYGIRGIAWDTMDTALRLEQWGLRMEECGAQTGLRRARRLRPEKQSLKPENHLSLQVVIWLEAD